MNSTVEKFFALLRYAIGTSDTPPQLTFADFQHVYDMSKKQSLTAIMFSAISKHNCTPTDIDGHEVEFEDLLMTWMGEKVKIERRNLKTNHNVIALADKVNSDGFECCLLKGQGNALLYPNPSLRTPGDIDMWTRPKNESQRTSIEKSIRYVIDYVRGIEPNAEASYHHIEYPEFNGTPVEIHYRPHFVLSFVHNRRLQNYFWNHANEQFHHIVRLDDGEIAVPTAEFNVFFQLSHIFNHLTHEGIGMRHILDFYFVLCKLWENSVNKQIISITLGKFGLRNFAASIMWILVTELGMPSKMAIVEPDKRRGRFVLHEILQGGNFGKFDNRHPLSANSSIFEVQFNHIRRNVQMLRYFPYEAVVEPFVRGVRFFQRIRMNKNKQVGGD